MQLLPGAIVVLTASCGGSTSHPPTTPTSSGSATSSSTTSTAPASVGGFVTPEVKFGTGEQGAPDPTTTVPVEVTGRPINPANDAGQAVIIDKAGYLIPEWLVAESTLPITWTNLSGKPQQVIFDDAPVHSAVLAPGATFIWTSPGFAINLTYHTANGHHARLTLQNPNTP
ncbi:MAG TPA: hypothetical protein VNC61_10195 [Acidimicrobiales bacterium]|nr:hypothetical protein [Acidimicrobiales bacterium]